MHMLPAEVSMYEAVVVLDSTPCMCLVGSLEFPAVQCIGVELSHELQETKHC